MGIIVKGCLLLVRFTLLNWFFWLLIGAITALKFYLNWIRLHLSCPGHIDGKTVIITGANTGLGYELSKTLAKRGARIIMACRNMGSAYHAKAAIMQETGNNQIDIQLLDLSSLWSVRQFAKNILENEERVDILIHCAGVFGIKDCKSNDDLQITWQINCLAPLLLTNLLLDKIKDSSPSRIIFTSSPMHHFSKLHLYLNKINDDGNYSLLRSYCDISLAKILAAKYLAKNLKEAGVTVNIANPGLVNVKFRRVVNIYLQQLLTCFLDFFAKTLKEGSATIIMLAVQPDLQEVTGTYFSDCKVSNCLSKYTKDIEMAEQLWKKYDELIGIKEDEKLK